MSNITYKTAKISVAELPVMVLNPETGKNEPYLLTAAVTDRYEHPVTGARAVRVLVDNPNMAKLVDQGLIAYKPDTKNGVTKFPIWEKKLSKVRTLKVKIQDRNYGDIPEGPRQAMAAIYAGELKLAKLRKAEAPAA